MSFLLPGVWHPFPEGLDGVREARHEPLPSLSLGFPSEWGARRLSEGCVAAMSFESMKLPGLRLCPQPCAQVPLPGLLAGVGQAGWEL